MQIFATLKGLQDKIDECVSQVNRLKKLLIQEAKEFCGEVFNSDDVHTSPSMIMELIKEADDLKKRRSSILSLSDEKVNFGQFNVTVNGKIKILSIEELLKVA